MHDEKLLKSWISCILHDLQLLVNPGELMMVAMNAMADEAA